MMKMFRTMDVGEELRGIAAYQEAMMLAQMGEYAKAISLLDQHLGSSPDVEVELFIKRETAPWLISLGRVDEAVTRLDYCSSLAAKSWGVLDERTLIIRNSQMYWTGKVGLTRKALDLAEKLLADAWASLDPRDELLNAIRNNAARIIEVGPNPAEAGRIYRDLLADYERWGEEGSPAALSARHNYADYLRDRGDFDDSLKVFQRLLLIVTEMRGITAEETLNVRNEVALTTYLVGREQEAVRQWEALVADLERFLGLGDPLTVDVIGTLLAEAMEDERLKEAVGWADKLIEAYVEGCDPELTASLVRIRNQMAESYAD